MVLWFYGFVAGFKEIILSERISFANIILFGIMYYGFVVRGGIQGIMAFLNESVWQAYGKHVHILTYKTRFPHSRDI